MKNTSTWRNYEQVAEYLLNHLRKELNLEKVEGKQKLVGIDSGTEWEVDAKGILEDNEGIVIIECRRHTTRALPQESMAGLAYRIKDTRAKKGIIVSPIGLQKGAKKVAKANNIISVLIDANSTPENFSLEFLNKLFLGTPINIEHKINASLMMLKKCSICGEKFVVKDNETECEECI